MRLETTGELQAYFKGQRNILRLYAWWKDGTQYVGTTGTTLNSAFEEICKEEVQAFGDYLEKGFYQIPSR